MSEPIEIEALLRESMDAAAPPTLTPTFTQRLTMRLRPRQLSAGAQRALRFYALAAAVVSVAVMRSQAVEWNLIAVSLAVTAAIGAILRPRLNDNRLI
ncbi:MAG TPA: hypothetical protein VHR45_09070 [Thermoanaerobaculia bacterium]|nr:hypothetical protein [Thermoanaerobaculia bacterium]